jgi:hypothetical protein
VVALLIYGQEKAAEQRVLEGQLAKVDATAKSSPVKRSTGSFSSIRPALSVSPDRSQTGGSGEEALPH